MRKQKGIIILVIVLLLVLSLDVKETEASCCSCSACKKAVSFIPAVVKGATTFIGGGSFEEGFKERMVEKESTNAPSPSAEAGFEDLSEITSLPETPLVKNVDLGGLHEVKKIFSTHCSTIDYNLKYNLFRNDELIYSTGYRSFGGKGYDVSAGTKGKCNPDEINLRNADVKGLITEKGYPVADKVTIEVSTDEVYKSYFLVRVNETIVPLTHFIPTAEQTYTFSGPILLYSTKLNSAGEFKNLKEILESPKNKPGETKSSSQTKVILCDAASQSADCLLTKTNLEKYNQLWILDTDPTNTLSSSIAVIKNFRESFRGGLVIASKEGFTTNISEGIKGRAVIDHSWEKFTNDKIPSYGADGKLSTSTNNNFIYARNIAQFLEQDPYNNQNLCTHRTGVTGEQGVWTGASCCGLSDKENKDWYYNDPSVSLEGVELGGCWNNSFVPSGNFPKIQGKETKQVVNVGGEFYKCGVLSQQLASMLTSPPTQKQITILTPNGGEKLKDGSTYRITWSSVGARDKVNILREGTAGFRDLIASDVPNTGYYDWTPNFGNTLDFSFKILLGNADASDHSDNFFTILPKTSSEPAPTIANIPSPPVPAPPASSLSTFSLKAIQSCGKITTTAGDFKVDNKFVTCNYAGEFEFKSELFDPTPKRPIWDQTKENCCTSNQCFNGNECVNVNDNDKNRFKNTDNKFFMCNKDSPKTTASWDELFLKSTPEDESVAGEKDYYCKSQSQCLLEKSKCVDSGQYSKDRYCDNGIWTSRTKFLVNKLLNRAGVNDFELVCGKAGNILNEALDDNFGNLNSGLSTSNSACVLKANDKVLFGTTLNTPINDKYKQSPLKAITSRDACDTVINSNLQSFEKCTPTKPVKQNLKIFYNPSLNTTIFSPEETLAQSNDDKFNALLKPDFDSIVSAMNSLPEEERERYKPIERTKYFETVFYLQKPGKRIFGFVEAKNTELLSSNKDIFMAIKYTNTEHPLAEGYCAELKDRIHKETNTRAECVKQGTDSIVVLFRVLPADESDAIKILKDLTQKLRLQ